jgi:hypothetical protein
MKFTFYLNLFTTFAYYSIYLPIVLHFTTLSFSLSSSLLQLTFFWKVANYADAYWFLYSSKSLLYVTRNI